MIARLRAFWARPIRDAERLPAFVLAATLVIGCALLFALLGRQDEAKPSPERRTLPEPVAPDAPPAAADAPPAQAELESAAHPGPSLAADPAAGAERARAAQRGQRRRLASAERVARRFLSGYLRFTYGQGDAAAIRSISPGLERRLAAAAPRVDAQTRALRPRVSALQAENLSRASVDLIAFVDDGARSYSFPLRLTRAGGAWQVSGLAGV